MTATCSTHTAATTASWLLRTHLELGAYASAVPCARGHVRSVAMEWGLRDLADTAELLASELVLQQRLVIFGSAGVVGFPCGGLAVASPV